MLWKTEQGYYKQYGWNPARVEGVGGGLIHVEIIEADAGSVHK